MSMSIMCKQCGEEISEERIKMRAVYCSKACKKRAVDNKKRAKEREFKQKSREERIQKLKKNPRKCVLCSKDIPIDVTIHGNAKYCSSFCRSEAGRTRARERARKLSKTPSLEEYESSPKVCPECKEEIPYERGKIKRIIYCSSKCGKRGNAKNQYVKPILPYRKRQQDDPQGVNNGFPSTIIGDILELQVASDLVSRGFYVYRSVTRSAPCDLVAIGPQHEVTRYEVRAGDLSSKGKVIFRVNPRLGLTDMYGVVLKDGSIEYFKESKE